MHDPVGSISTALAGRLTRRQAVKTYVPPTLALIGVSAVTSHGLSGNTNAGRGNGSEGNPDQDPGNSAGHNQGGDGVVAVPGTGNPHADGDSNAGGSSNAGGGNAGGRDAVGGNSNAGGGLGKGPKK